MQKLLIFGGGYTAQALIRHVAGMFSEILYTTRSSQGEQAVLFDGKQSLPASVFKGTTHLLITIPPQEKEDLVLRHHQHFLRNLPELEWIGYLSSTGVYGDYNGKWVDEHSPLMAFTARSINRALIEQQWLDLFTRDGLPIHIFRLAGIYGPGRSVFENIKSGKAQPVDKSGHVFSRIHVMDIVQVLSASMRMPQGGKIYNVADDLPSSSLEVLRYAYRLLNRPLPDPVPYESANLSPMLNEFYNECRRVSNRRIKEELGITLAFPNYKKGLASLLPAPENS